MKNLSARTLGICLILLIVAGCTVCVILAMLGKMNIFWPVLLLLVLGGGFLSALGKKQSGVSDPIQGVRLMAYLTMALMLALAAFDLLNIEETPEWFFSIFFLAMSMSYIYLAFKQQQERIRRLEDQIKQIAVGGQKEEI